METRAGRPIGGTILAAPLAAMWALAGCSDQAPEPGAPHHEASGGQGGTGGTGAGGQIPSDQATSATECAFEGGGGADVVACDYVTGVFSQPLPADRVDLNVETSLGDRLDLAPQDDVTRPTLALDVSADGDDALGFHISRQTRQPQYSPEALSVVVLVDDQEVSNVELHPSYTCVELTIDDWCWKASPETVPVTLP